MTSTKPKQEPLAEWLRRQIEKKLMTQREFAHTAKIPLNTIKQWLTGRQKNPRGTSRERLARATRTRREQIDAIIGPGRNEKQRALNHADAAAQRDHQNSNPCASSTEPRTCRSKERAPAQPARPNPKSPCATTT